MNNHKVVGEFLNTVSLPYRGNCPICGNSNTFSASEVDGKLLYKCFHAGCELRGSTKSVLTLDKLSSIISRNSVEKSFNSKDYAWTNPLQNEACYAFMERFHCLEPYLDRRVDIRYDPKLNRIVFILRHDGVEYGAVGRSLSGMGKGQSQVPKWYIYGRVAGCPFIVQCKNDLHARSALVLVEDAVSACRISSVVSSVALLGTNFNFSFQYINAYERLFICLDDDATRKSLQIQAYLNLTKPTNIIPLRRDLKYLSNSELREWYDENVAKP